MRGGEIRGQIVTRCFATVLHDVAHFEGFGDQLATKEGAVVIYICILFHRSDSLTPYQLSHAEFVLLTDTLLDPAIQFFHVFLVSLEIELSKGKF